MHLYLLLGAVLGAIGVQAAPPAASLPFVANRGQWEQQVKYAVAVPGGQLYLENNCFTYRLYAEAPHDHDAATRRPVASHAYRVSLVGGAPSPVLAGEEKQTAYHNYFLGNDPGRWAAEVPLYAGVRYRAIYPGVDLRWHQQGEGQLEYDFELAPGARPDAIKLRYDGLDGLAISPEGHLQLRTSVGEVREQAPVAWQLDPNGQRVPVPCRFVLKGQEVRFALGKYDPARPLVIDPVLVFATYSGSAGGMSANTAISDAQGNLYTGSYVLGPGYPVTLGAIKATYRYGNMGISKLSATGNALLYATYLGGNNIGEDYPLDFDINTAGELLILGASSAPDYPTTPGAFDRTLGTTGTGGFTARDLVLTRLNANGTAILASTFLGGSGEEAGATSTVPGSVTIEPSGDVLVVSSTTSLDYPVLNAAQATNGGGGREGVLSRLSPNLTALRWSTYVGGSAQDGLNDVKVAPNGEVYVCGTTNSNNLPVGTGGLLAQAPAGFGRNGFVLRFGAAGARLSGTFLGTTAEDVARFLDFDATGNVLVAGASEGVYPTTAGTFSAVAPGTTGVFVHGLAPALNTTLFSTMVSVVGAGQLSSGNGSNVVTAFGRDDCGRLYFSAYAGVIASPGAPRTSDALSNQPRSLYLAVLDQNAARLLYGTFIGETNNSPFTSGSTHVHLAASNQVTRAGVLYHVTCNQNRSFGTTPGAYSAGLTSNNDAASFKFNLAPPGGGVLQLAVAPPAPGCAPHTVTFDNTTAGDLQYSWDFGDGSPAVTAKSPRHTYTVPGTYTARVVASRPPGSAGCGPATATTSMTVVVAGGPPLRSVTDSLDCGNQLLLDPSRLVPFVSGRAYQWSTGATTPFINVAAPGTYRVEVDQGQLCPAVVEYEIKLSRAFDMPNVITANGDSKNDTFRAPAAYGTPEFKVYNRWGRLVFEAAAYQNNWGAQGQPAGVYFYTIRQPSCGIELKGWVEVIK